MFKKLPVIFSALTLAFILSNCSAGQLNTVNNPGFVRNEAGEAPVKMNKREAVIHLNNFDAKDISEIQVDDQPLSEKEYTRSGTQIKLPNLEPGKHVVKFKHSKYGAAELPLEVRQTNENNYQFNPTIENDKINNWELGIDADKDGTIDDNSFFSRQVEGYVVVREFSGNTNYLPKEKFNQDFKKPKVFPRPDNFKFPDEQGLAPKKRPQPGFEQKPVFLEKGPEFQHRPGRIVNPALPGSGVQPDKISSKVYFPFPQKLNLYKIAAVFAAEHLLPENAYLKEKNSLIFNSEALKGNNGHLRLYLIDETGMGVLLTINPKRPIFNEKNSGSTQAREIFIVAADLEYSLQDKINFDIGKIEQLRRDLKPGIKPAPNQLPFFSGQQPRPKVDGKVLPVSFGSMPANVNEPGSAGKKYVKIDENGEIVEYTEQVPSDFEQDVSLSGNLVTQPSAIY